MQVIRDAAAWVRGKEPEVPEVPPTPTEVWLREVREETRQARAERTSAPSCDWLERQILFRGDEGTVPREH